MARAVAPNPSINVIPDGKEGDTVRLGVTLDHSGSRYDTLEYAWTRDGGSASEFDDQTAARPVWTRPDVGSDQQFTIRCVVTARGTGHNADNGTSAERFDTEPATVQQVPDAVAPTGAVRTAGATESGFVAIPNLFERDSVRVGIEFSDSGTNDYIDYAWTLVNFEQSSRGTVFQGAFDDPTAAAPIMTLPSVGGNTSVYARCVVTAHGRNNTTRRGTTAVRTMMDAHFTVLDYPDAAAPGVDVANLANGRSGTTREIWANIHSGGHYDRIEYQWHMWQRGQTQNAANDLADDVFDDPTVRTPRLTYPSVQANTIYDVQVDITVYGDDETAEAGTTHSRSASGDFTVLALPDAQGPNLVRIDDIPRGDMRTRVQLGVGFYSGVGTWDRDTYVWTCRRTIGSTEHNHDSSLSDTTIRRPVWTRPDVDSDDESTPFVFTCVGTFHGDGVKAKDGTSSRRTAEFTANGRVDYVNIMERMEAGGIGVYVTDEDGNEIVIDAMFPNAQESA